MWLDPFSAYAFHCVGLTPRSSLQSTGMRDEVRATAPAAHHRAISRKQSSVSASRTQTALYWPAWGHGPSLSLSRGLLGLEAVGWQGAVQEPGEEGNPPGLRIGRGRPPKDHWEEERRSS